MNRLAGETSPYLRQHADNPVDWHPWGAEPFELAARRDVPVFVSIGYASCHWCHVMAHESFSDPAVADALAASFVSVKVDREERPDVDAVYMSATQALTGSGGWPMSVFCTPDGRPFYAGTYFPPSDRHGLPSFRRVLAAMADAWATRRGDVEAQAAALVAAVARQGGLTDRLDPRSSPPGAGGGAAALERLVGELSARFDPEWGGWGSAPKFPRPTLVELCLLHHRRTGDQRSAAMATTTLDAMAAGGLYDHLAGGFARYSTDRRWLVPHFEKMLTDQALLARAYLHAWQATGRSAYRQVATETLAAMLAELGGGGGGLCSSVDADADGVEGGHATFTAGQLRQALDDAGRPDLVEVAADWYQVGEPGNWEGTNVLHRPLRAPLARPAEVDEARRLLLAARRRRPQPAVDDKVLTEWNAMAVATLAEAASATGDPGWAAAAASVAEFLFAELRLPDGRWLRSWQGGRSRHLAFAADLAWVVEACLRLAELTGAAGWLARAEDAGAQLLERFWDGDGAGGFFTTAHDGEPLVVRPKDVVDGAVPSANSVATQALLRLAALTGDHRFAEPAERVLALSGRLLAEEPAAVADLVAAALAADEPTEVVVTGDRPDLVAEVRRRWLPGAVLAWGEPTGGPLWDGRDDGLAYVCHRFTCRSPAADPATLARQLEE
ncbi:MAG: thioredoxin domain-containing protein [Acidimicrobiales bacterium]